MHQRASLLLVFPLLATFVAAPATAAMTGPRLALNLARQLVAMGVLPAPGTAAQRVAIGPEGELEARVVDAPLLLDQFLLNALRQDDAGLVEEHHPDGSVTIHLEGRYQSASVARVGARGVVVTCTSGHDGTTRCLHEAPPASEREEQ